MINHGLDSHPVLLALLQQLRPPLLFLLTGTDNSSIFLSSGFDRVGARISPLHVIIITEKLRIKKLVMNGCVIPGGGVLFLVLLLLSSRLPGYITVICAV